MMLKLTPRLCKALPSDPRTLTIFLKLSLIDSYTFSSESVPLFDWIAVIKRS